MKPALAVCVVALAVDVLVDYVRVVSAEPRDFLFQTKSCVLHERAIAAVPQLAMPLNRPAYSVAHGFDHVLVNQFTIERREFLMPVDDLRWSVSGRTHIDILPI